MKVIFLDIDGPLAYSDEDSYPIVIQNGLSIPYGFEQEDCDALRDIIAETGASIVLSSDWRLYYNVESMNTVLSYYGVPPVIIDYTDKQKAKLSSSGEMDRAYQILRWVENHTVSNWVALDDFDLSYFFSNSGYNNNLVQVRGANNEDQSVTLRSVKDKAIDILNTNHGIF